ncbi:G protein coupled receptor 3 [Elephant endotheliotropic herpesvirus 6]|nr:G protein coupled receptor 3 [Elephant endotheliotropic herpesvirus 6]
MGLTHSGSTSPLNCTNNTGSVNTTCQLDYHEKIFLGFTSVAGVFLTGPCLVFAIFYLKKCYIYSPYPMLYTLILFLCGIIGTFLSVVSYHLGETLMTFFVYVPLTACFSCILAHIGNILLTKRYDCRLRDGVILTASVLFMIVQLSVMLSASVDANAKTGHILLWKWKLSHCYCHMGFAIITAFGMALCCCRDYPHGVSVFGVSMASLVLWIFYMCIGTYENGILVSVFIGANAFVFLLMYAIPELAFLYCNYKFVFSTSGSDTVRLFSDV